MRKTPTGYPTELERDVVLQDGRIIHLRPIRPTDARQLQTAIESADLETINRRFLGPRPAVTAALVEHLATVDYADRMAVVACHGEVHGVGIARYDRLPGTDTAEVAVAVDPSWRNSGVAMELLTTLGLAALDRGIRRFVAYYAGDNVEVTRLIAASGLPHRTVVSGGIAEVMIELACPNDSPD